MPYNVFISIANVENLSFPVMNLTYYSLNMGEHIQNVVSNKYTLYI